MDTRDLASVLLDSSDGADGADGTDGTDGTDGVTRGSRSRGLKEEECLNAKPAAPPLSPPAASAMTYPVSSLAPPPMDPSGAQSAFHPVRPPGQPGGFTGAGAGAVARPPLINRLDGRQVSRHHQHRSTTNTCAPDNVMFQPISPGATALTTTAAAAKPRPTTHRTTSTQTPPVYPRAGRVSTGAVRTSFIYQGTFGDINSFTPGAIFTRQAPPMAPRAGGTTPSLPGGGAGGAANPSSSNSDFSDDRSDCDLVHTSDGNTVGSDGEMCSVIGSIDGENRSGKSDSSFSPSTHDSTSSSSDGMSMSSSQEKEEDTESVVHYDIQGDRPAIDFDRPMGMMIAIEISGGGFKCGKVVQKYMKNATTGGKEMGHAILEVVFKDGSIQEFCPEQVLQYRTTYLQNEGEKGCEEFKVKI